MQCPQLGPNFRTLVRIRTFLSQPVRIWSEFDSKSLILVQISSEASVLSSYFIKTSKFPQGVTVHLLLDIVLGTNKMILCFFFVQRYYGIEFS